MSIDGAITRLLEMTSNKFHTKRPRAGTSARIAWDILSARPGPPIVSMRLLGGYWSADRGDTVDLDEVCAIEVLSARWNGE